jgi:hypothetical protein
MFRPAAKRLAMGPLRRVSPADPPQTISESTTIPQEYLKQAPPHRPMVAQRTSGVRLEAFMKRTIIATTIALGLACASGVSVAQEQTQAANLQHVTVTAIPGQYETYVIDLNPDSGLEVLVGSTHRQYMQAWRTAGERETLRKQGMAQAPLVSVAIDNSSGAGLARQVRLSDRARNTLAIVNVYCHQAVRAEGQHCLLVSQPVATGAYSQSLASRQGGRPSLAQVQADQAH